MGDSYALIVTIGYPDDTATRNHDGYYPVTNWRWSRRTEVKPPRNGVDEDVWNTEGKSTLNIRDIPQPDPGQADTVTFCIWTDDERFGGSVYEWVQLDFAPDGPDQDGFPFHDDDGNEMRKGFSGAPDNPVKRPKGKWMRWSGAFEKPIANTGAWRVTAAIQTSVDDPNNPGKKCRFSVDPRMCVGPNCE